MINPLNYARDEARHDPNSHSASTGVGQYYSSPKVATSKNETIIQWCIKNRGGSSWGAIEATHPLKPKNATLFTMIFYNSENSIRVIRPFCRQLYCHYSVVTRGGSRVGRLGRSLPLKLTKVTFFTMILCNSERHLGANRGSTAKYYWNLPP